MRSNQHRSSPASIYMSINMLSLRHGFRPKRNHFRGQSSHWALFGHTGCWSIAKCSQSSCRNYTGGFRSWPPATCRFSTRRSFDHHGKGNGNFVNKKEFRKMKKSRISHWSESDENAIDCEIACDCVKRTQTWFYMLAYVKKFSPGSTQLPTSRHLLSHS